MTEPTRARTFQLYLDGALRPAASGATYDSHDPSTGELVATFADAGGDDVMAAISAARRAFDESDWATQGRESRVRVVRGFIEAITARMPEFIDLEIRDAGHTSRMANLFTVPLAVEHSRVMLELYAARRDIEPLPPVETPAPSWNYARKEPVGVCALLSPFNFPLVLTMWKLAPALVTGCTAVLKPSPLASATVALLGEVAAEVGLPPGVLNIVTTSAIGPAELLTSHPMIDKVAFTGSTDTGRRIMRGAAETLKDITLELGGKGPSVFLDDVDLDIAAPGALWACFLHTGQMCEGGTRLLVPRSRYDETLERLTGLTERLVVGPADDFGTDIGPVISDAQLDRIGRYVKLGLDQGARLVTGGEPRTDGDLARGHFFAPTIFADVSNDMTIAQEEIFGPVLSVIPYDGGDTAAVRIANDSAYGLAASVWSRDVPRAQAVAHRIRCGTVWVNDHHLLNAYTPFGGYKASGVGRELGDEGLDAYLETKRVHVDQTTTLAQKYWYGVLGLGD